MKKIRRVFGVSIAATLAGGLLAAAPAHASAASTASTASAPEASVAVAYVLEAKNPAKVGRKIRSTGRLRVSHNRPITVKVYGQRKVCGAWGCNWHNKAEKSVGKAWAKSTGHVRVNQSCVGGRHRYRTLSHGFIREPWGTGSASKLSAGLEFRC